ncbi:hypothetical protein MUS1_09510 [Marinomonas ushuaiensis DSM 15871]|uniref:Uncharacterized protein n=1 Tax=Marinomonas ushuaiensis DSM 15871 TaxID=1122207 RepID=X7E927_9GAMM|nr:hypothetical protein MUS1_09510 [Marinomonas ushuaiensis DSM 15871]
MNSKRYIVLRLKVIINAIIFKAAMMILCYLMFDFLIKSLIRNKYFRLF